MSVGWFVSTAMLLSTQQITAENLDERWASVPAKLFAMAERPSGTMFCDKHLRARQTRAFERRYGQRFRTLIALVSKKEGMGRDPGDILVSDCFPSTAEEAKTMLDDFGVRLAAMEARYGIPPEK